MDPKDQRPEHVYLAMYFEAMELERSIAVGNAHQVMIGSPDELLSMLHALDVVNLDPLRDSAERAFAGDVEGDIAVPELPIEHLYLVKLVEHFLSEKNYAAHNSGGGLIPAELLAGRMMVNDMVTRVQSFAGVNLGPVIMAVARAVYGPLGFSRRSLSWITSFVEGDIDVPELPIEHLFIVKLVEQFLSEKNYAAHNSGGGLIPAELLAGRMFVNEMVTRVQSFAGVNLGPAIMAAARAVYGPFGFSRRSLSWITSFVIPGSGLRRQLGNVAVDFLNGGAAGAIALPEPRSEHVFVVKLFEQFFAERDFHGDNPDPPSGLLPAELLNGRMLVIDMVPSFAGVNLRPLIMAAARAVYGPFGSSRRSLSWITSFVVGGSGLRGQLEEDAVGSLDGGGAGDAAEGGLRGQLEEDAVGSLDGGGAGDAAEGGK